MSMNVSVLRNSDYICSIHNLTVTVCRTNPQLFLFSRNLYLDSLCTSDETVLTVLTDSNDDENYY